MEGIIARQGASLDRALVLDEFRPLPELKEGRAPEDTRQKLFARHTW